MNGLGITGSKGNRYQVSYQAVITGQIFQNNLKHQEKSDVSEELEVVNGKARLVRTLKGRFWYIR